MPELPEVETVRAGLEKHVVGKKIVSVKQLHPRALRAESLNKLTIFKGAKIKAVKRRGKFMWLEFDRDEVLVGHLGMSGQFKIQKSSSEYEKHLRANFELSNGKDMRFIDQRTFGWLSIEETLDNIPTSAQHIAPDPFDPLFDKSATIQKYRKRSIPIKNALLNQEIMSGVGNIYADETLWRAKIHPLTRTSRLTEKELATIITKATQVMRSAIDKGGTSFDDLYINVNGESGFFEQSLSAYGQDGTPCRRCRTLIKRIVISARSLK